MPADEFSAQRLFCRRWGWFRGSYRLRRDERKLFGDVDSGAAEQLLDNGLVETRGVVFDADGLPLFLELDAANAVYLAHIAEREHSCFGGVLFIAEEDFDGGHGVMITASHRFASGSAEGDAFPRLVRRSMSFDFAQDDKFGDAGATGVWIYKFLR